MVKLYICLTYYHTLITLIKSLVYHEHYDVWIMNDIPDYKNLVVRLENTHQFNSIKIIDAESINKEFTYSFKSKNDRILHQKKRCKEVVEKYGGRVLKCYSDIYIYHDFSPIGKYLIEQHIKYHLLEDALDYFKYFDSYYTLDKGAFTPGTLKFIFKGITGFHCWGMSHSCIDIEVNDLNGIKIPKGKCLVVPRKELFNKLSNSDKIAVFNVFAAGKEVNMTKGKTAILCTQPLYKDNFVNSMVDQKTVFESIVRDYTNNGYHVVVKPHPRDDMDYSDLVQKYRCDLIDKNLPSEVLNFNPNAKYDVAISITSTAINFLQYAHEKKIMGKEYISEVLGNAK